MTWPPAVTRDLDAVRECLDGLILAVDDVEIPILGSPEWVAAPSAMKLASVARWALIQVDELSPDVIAARLAAEIAAGRRDYLRAMKSASVAVSGGADWRKIAMRTPRAEVERRRAQVGPLARGGGDAT